MYKHCPHCDYTFDYSSDYTRIFHITNCPAKQPNIKVLSYDDSHTLLTESANDIRHILFQSKWLQTSLITPLLYIDTRYYGFIQFIYYHLMLFDIPVMQEHYVAILTHKTCVLSESLQQEFCQKIEALFSIFNIDPFSWQIQRHAYINDLTHDIPDCDGFSSALNEIFKEHLGTGYQEIYSEYKKNI